MNISEQKSLRSNIWKFYAFDIFAGMFFAVPIIVLFWQDNGLNLTEVMLLQSVFAILIFLFEIPTGYFADVFGRKNSLLISGVAFFIAILTYSLASSFSLFLLAEFFFALAVAFNSGAAEAFLYDTLVDLKEEKRYAHFTGRAMFYGLLANAFANILGGFVGKIDLRWTFYFTLPFMFLLIPLSLSLYEPQRHKLIVKKGHFSHISKTLHYTLVDNVALRWIIIYTAVIGLLTNVALWLYQPYFVLSGVDILYFGIIFALFAIFTAVIAKYASQIEQTLGRKLSLVLLPILLALSYFFMGTIVFWFSFIFILLQQFVRGFSGPVLSDYVNKLTPSESRATILSINSMFSRLLYALLIPIIGWIADLYSLVQALFVMGFTALIASCVILFLVYKAKTFNNSSKL